MTTATVRMHARPSTRTGTRPGTRSSRRPVDLLDPTERLSDYGLVVPVGLESCTGLLVVHADGTAECLESAGCPADPVLHTGLISCADAVDDCCAGS